MFKHSCVCMFCIYDHFRTQFLVRSPSYTRPNNPHTVARHNVGFLFDGRRHWMPQQQIMSRRARRYAVNPPPSIRLAVCCSLCLRVYAIMYNYALMRICCSLCLRVYATMYTYALMRIYTCMLHVSEAHQHGIQSLPTYIQTLQTDIQIYYTSHHQ